MTAKDLPQLQNTLDRYVTVVCLSGGEIVGDLVEVCADGISIDIDATSGHELAGTLLFLPLAELVAVREVRRPPFEYFR